MREASLGCRYSGDRASIPEGLADPVVRRLDAQQPTQMAIISLKSLLGDLLRRSCFPICAPKLDCPASLIGNHPLLALARPSGTSFTARSRSFGEKSHGLP